MNEEAVLPLPEIFAPAESFAFTRTLWATHTTPRVILDFAPLKFSLPFGMLVVASELKRFAASRPPQTLFLRGISAQNAAHSYLSFIGFFEHVGIRYGSKPGEARGSSSYFPITVLKRSELMARLEESGKPIAFAVEAEAQKLAVVLTQKHDMTVNRPIAYCLREIIRNTFEHGATDQSVVCAQRWKDGEVELGIVDRGRGVRRSLAERMETPSDAEALALAIQPGISRSADVADPDEWANSGFGLYVLSELGRLCGSFAICSGTAAIAVEAGTAANRDYAFSGTAVCLRMKKPKGANFDQLLQEIVARGEEMSAASEFPRRASKSSQTA